MQEKNCELKMVKDVWADFITEFNSGDLVHDQILIVSDSMLLRGPNFDLLNRSGLDWHIN